jgi:GNAT superfamily N-acetyltransferase
MIVSCALWTFGAHDVITAHVETWSGILDEAKGLFPLHWEELALNKDKVPLSVQYGVYAEHEAAGRLLVVTLRQSGRLVGYYVGLMAPGLHYSTCLTLTMDIFWTHPDIRGAGLPGVKLFRKVEEEARRRGVHRIFHGSKLHKDASRLFQYLEMEPVEVYYTKWIGA